MIRYKAKNPYWQAGKSWKTLHKWPLDFEDLDFQSYNYILGDQIHTEPNAESKAAFKTVKMWKQLQA